MERLRNRAAIGATCYLVSTLVILPGEGPVPLWTACP